MQLIWSSGSCHSGDLAVTKWHFNCVNHELSYTQTLCKGLCHNDKVHCFITSRQRCVRFYLIHLRRLSTLLHHYISLQHVETTATSHCTFSNSSQPSRTRPASIPTTVHTLFPLFITQTLLVFKLLQNFSNHSITQITIYHDSASCYLEASYLS